MWRGATRRAHGLASCRYVPPHARSPGSPPSCRCTAQNSQEQASKASCAATLLHSLACTHHRPHTLLSVPQHRREDQRRPDHRHGPGGWVGGGWGGKGGGGGGGSCSSPSPPAHLPSPPPPVQSGRTVSLVAKYRPPMPILAVVVPKLSSTRLGWQLEGERRSTRSVEPLLPCVLRPFLRLLLHLLLLGPGWRGSLPSCTAATGGVADGLKTLS